MGCVFTPFNQSECPAVCQPLTLIGVNMVVSDTNVAAPNDFLIEVKTKSIQYVKELCGFDVIGAILSSVFTEVMKTVVSSLFQFFILRCSISGDPSFPNQKELNTRK